MQSQTVKLKRPAQPSRENEDRDLKQTADELIQAIGEGVFDTHLDLIDKAITERIRKSQEENGDAVEPRRVASEKIRVLRSAPAELIWNRQYRLRGEKYAGVVVSFLDLVGQADGGIPKARVSVDTGNKNVEEGKTYIVPSAALEDIPEIRNVNVPPRLKNYTLDPCKKCGGAVEYSGKGRPHTLCENCR